MGESQLDAFIKEREEMGNALQARFLKLLTWMSLFREDDGARFSVYIDLDRLADKTEAGFEAATCIGSAEIDRRRQTLWNAWMGLVDAMRADGTISEYPGRGTGIKPDKEWTPDVVNMLASVERAASSVDYFVRVI